MIDWIEAVQLELGTNIALDIDSILDVAREAAHTVERPAAPVTTFLLGCAVANGMDFNLASNKITALAQKWSAKE